MKIRSYLFAVSITVLLAGCAKDENGMFGGKSDNPTVEGEGTMNLSLKYAVSTRANDDREDGTKEESNIRDLTVYYFDANKGYLGKGEAPQITQHPGDNDNIESDVIAVGVPAEVVKYVYGNKDVKAYVIAVLNGKGKACFGLEKDLAVGASYAEFNKVLESEISEIAVENSFLMTSSNYVKDGVEMALVEINSDNVGIKSNAASKNPENVKIAVERVAAKVIVKAKEGVELDILGWGLNVTNKKFYPVKEVKTGFFDENFNTNYANWNQKDTWSNPTNKRSHWAVDPNYTTGIVSSDGTSNEFNLLKWDGLIKTEEVAYCLENTFHQSMQNRNSTTTAIIVAKFNPYNTGSGTWINWKQQNFSEEAFRNEVLRNVKEKIDFTQYYYRLPKGYATGDNVVGSYIYYPLGFSNFTFAANGTDEIKFGHDGPTIGYKSMNLSVKLLENNLADGLYTRPADPDSEDAWDNSKVENVEEIKTNIANAIAEVLNSDKAVVYVNGYNYYEVPLRHFNDTEVAGFDGGAYEGKHLGRYGIVRNNIYKLTVNSIDNPGKPITDEPIIPSEDQDDFEKFFINVDVEVLSWTVRKQEVDL